MKIRNHLRRLGGLGTAASLFLISLFLFARALQAQEPTIPGEPPQAEAGLVIYTERQCNTCHGDQGAGDGAQALQAGFEPTAFADPNYRLTAVPNELFIAIANGNLEAGMPPFGESSSNPLTTAQIWDAVAAVYSFATPVESIELGERIVEEQGVDIDAWPGLDYWFVRSNQQALVDLEGGQVFGIDVAALSDEEKMAVVDYGRSLSYEYSDPLAAFAPIESATVSGTVLNGTTNEPFSDATILLRAFTTDLQQTLTMTSTVGADGAYSFDLEDVDPDWVFLASVSYNDLTFNSSAVQIERQDPNVTLPISVYETTIDASAIQIDQLHMILNFGEGQLQVSELYVFSNSTPAVFIGESGDFNEGTVEISLPAGATGVDFQRAFGSLDNFVPATDLIQTETGWADTVPLRPGAGGLNLLVSYVLPYDGDLQLAHPLGYRATSATAILPDVGVTLSGDGWISQGTQSLPSGDFSTYVNPELAQADAVSLTLDGRPTQVTDAQGNVLTPTRNQTNEIVIGAVGLLVAVGAAVFLARNWQQQTDETAIMQEPDTNDLLHTIAELDDMYEAGEIDEDVYTERRDRLKAQLAAIWEEENEPSQ